MDRRDSSRGCDESGGVVESSRTSWGGRMMDSRE